MSILVVDADPGGQLLISDALEYAGYDVFFAVDGQDALRVLKRHAPKLRVLVTAVSLGGRVDGWEVGRRAVKLNAAMAVIYICSDPTTDDADKAGPRGLIIHKPFSPDQLVKAVSDLAAARR